MNVAVILGEDAYIDQEHTRRGEHGRTRLRDEDDAKERTQSGIGEYEDQCAGKHESGVECPSRRAHAEVAQVVLEELVVWILRRSDEIQDREYDDRQKDAGRAEPV